jgi:H+-translocating NAD(P) transhydrogenase subunit alpha
MNAVPNEKAVPSAMVVMGVPRETLLGERRVALTPLDVKRLVATFDIIIESGAGSLAGFLDNDYVQAGARIADLSTLQREASVIVSVRAPPWIADIQEERTLISLGGRDSSLANALEATPVVHLGLERLPRITRAQSMDVLSSQASMAGYAAVLEGARRLPVILPMLTTAAGVIKPANMIALGAGVAGLQALATARRLGAVTHGFDVRESAREQVESVGATFISADVAFASAETRGGYAREQSADEQALLRRALADHLRSMQLIVTTAQIPGHQAPLLIDDETLAVLAPGTVIIDLAAESGGNTSRTRADKEVSLGGVTIFGPTQLASQAAGDASRLYGGNIRHLLEHLGTENGALKLDPSDAITSALLGLPAPSRVATS